MEVIISLYLQAVNHSHLSFITIIPACILPVIQLRNSDLHLDQPRYEFCYSVIIGLQRRIQLSGHLPKLDIFHMVFAFCSIIAELASLLQLKPFEGNNVQYRCVWEMSNTNMWYLYSIYVQYTLLLIYFA